MRSRKGEKRKEGKLKVERLRRNKKRRQRSGEMGGGGGKKRMRERMRREGIGTYLKSRAGV